MYMFIKLSKWYSKTIVSVEDEMNNINAHLSNGDIIAFGDDIETFADAIGIDPKEIESAD